MDTALNLHEDFRDFAEHVLAEHGPDITLADVAELANQGQAEQFTADAGLGGPGHILAALGALKAGFPGTTRLADLLERDAREQRQRPDIQPRPVEPRWSEKDLAAFTGGGPLGPKVWQPVYYGLLLVLSGTLLGTAVAVVVGLAVLEATKEGDPIPGQGMTRWPMGRFGGLVAVAAWLGGFILTLEGKRLCSKAPAVSGVGPLATWSFVFDLLSPLTGLGLAILLVRGAELPGVPLKLFLPTLVAATLASIAHLLFVFAVGRAGAFSGDRAAPGLARAYLIGSVGLAAAIAAYNVVTALDTLDSAQRVQAVNTTTLHTPHNPVQPRVGPPTISRHARQVIESLAVSVAIGLLNVVLYVGLLLRTLRAVGRAMTPLEGAE